MRIIYPDEVNKEREALIPYMEYRESDGWALKHDAPPEIVERYKKLHEEIERIREGAM